MLNPGRNGWEAILKILNNISLCTDSSRFPLGLFFGDFQRLFRGCILCFCVE